MDAPTSATQNMDLPIHYHTIAWQVNLSFHLLLQRNWHSHVNITHINREGEPRFPIPPHILVPSAIEQKLGVFGALPNSNHK